MVDQKDQKRYTINLEEDSETGELILPFTEELLAEVGWKPGDNIKWIDNGNGSWTLQKVNTKHGTSQ
jgi:hypothetical protein